MKKNTMKKITVMILWTTEDIEYYLIDGDQSELDGEYINSSTPRADELGDLMYHAETGECLQKRISLAEFRAALLAENTILIQCGNNF